jgi:hypothetical protein
LVVGEKGVRYQYSNRYRTPFCFPTLSGIAHDGSAIIAFVAVLLSMLASRSMVGYIAFASAPVLFISMAVLGFPGLGQRLFLAVVAAWLIWLSRPGRTEANQPSAGEPTGSNPKSSY